MVRSEATPVSAQPTRPSPPGPAEVPGLIRGDTFALHPFGSQPDHCQRANVMELWQCRRPLFLWKAPAMRHLHG
ncbi:hypothetical protein J2S46_000356 [Kitasatospora herbaricolor]|nr:hypothetical protein [Kitasatospora herbaricolor]